MTQTQAEPAPAPLVARFTEDDLDLLEPDARARFVQDGLPWEELGPRIAWELLYRKEPRLYDRLVAGETIHPSVVDALPRGGRCVEIAAGTGRLTRHLIERCDSVTAIEPAGALRAILAERLPAVDARAGYFHDTGLPDGCADLVAACSAFTADEAHGGRAGLAEMERICAPGGTIALVWPADVDWLGEHGFSYVAFDGDMAVTFESVEEAVELASIFYPHAVREIERRDEAAVPYDVLGMNAPRDIAMKRMP